MLGDNLQLAAMVTHSFKPYTSFLIGAATTAARTAAIGWFRLSFPGSHAALLSFLNKNQYKSKHTTKQALRFLYIERENIGSKFWVLDKLS